MPPLDLARCPLCDKAVVYEVGKKLICPECAAEESELYKRVRTLLRDYPNHKLSVSDVARMLGVDEKKISYLIDDGMFQLVHEKKLKDPY